MAKRKGTKKPANRKENDRNILLTAIADLIVSLIAVLVSHLLER